MMDDLIVALKKDLRAKIMDESIVNIVGATDEAFRMLQLVGDESLRGFREFPEGRSIVAAVHWVKGSDVGVLVRMKPNTSSPAIRPIRRSFFMDFCNTGFVLVKMMD